MTEDIDMHVLQKYDIMQKLGKGAYGVVWKAVEIRSGDIVAIKKNFDAFENATDAQRCFREIVYLQELAGHSNIIKLRKVIKAANDCDMYLIFNFMETDLHMLIRANVLEDIHREYIIY